MNKTRRRKQRARRVKWIVLWELPQSAIHAHHVQMSDYRAGYLDDVCRSFLIVDDIDAPSTVEGRAAYGEWFKSPPIVQ